MVTAAATLCLALAVSCGSKSVTDTIYFRTTSSQSAEGNLISSLLANPAKPLAPGIEHYQVLGIAKPGTGAPRVIVTFRSGTSRAQVDTFNQPFLTSGLIDHVTVSS